MATTWRFCPAATLTCWKSITRANIRGAAVRWQLAHSLSAPVPPTPSSGRYAAHTSFRGCACVAVHPFERTPVMAEH